MSTSETSYDRLKRYVRPPQSPLARVTADEWPAVEERIGTTLPDDYKMFIEEFGGCEFWKYLQIRSPAGRVGLLDNHEQTSRIVKRIQSKFDMFPVANGLFLFGGDENGNLYYWKTSTLSKDWTVIAVTPDFLERFDFNGTFCDFLIWLIVTSELPDFLAAIDFRSRSGDIVSSCGT